MSVRIYQNVLRPVDRVDLRVAVRLSSVGGEAYGAGVIKVASFAAEHGGIHDQVFIDAEHVAIAESLSLVDAFAFVRDFVADEFSHILDRDFPIEEAAELGRAYSSVAKRPFLWMREGATSTFLGMLR